MLAYILRHKYNNKLLIAPAPSLLSHEAEGVRRVLGAAHGRSWGHVSCGDGRRQTGFKGYGS